MWWTWRIFYYILPFFYTLYALVHAHVESIIFSKSANMQKYARIYIFRMVLVWLKIDKLMYIAASGMSFKAKRKYSQQNCCSKNTLLASVFLRSLSNYFSMLILNILWVFTRIKSKHNAPRKRNALTDWTRKEYYKRLNEILNNE